MTRPTLQDIYRARDLLTKYMSPDSPAPLPGP